MKRNDERRSLWRLAGAAAGLSIIMGGASVTAEPAGAEGVVSDDPVITIDGVSINLEQLKAMAAAGGGGSKKAKDDGKKWSDVAEGFRQVTSTTDGKSLYNVWINDETQDVLAELPRGYQSQNHFFAMTVAGGQIFAGLQGGDTYTQWRKYDDRMALIEPQLYIRSTGDQESKDSVKMIFTDTVLLDVPIVCDGPNGQPVIDLDAMLVGKATEFFGGQARGLNGDLTTVNKVKAFPENIEIAFEGPVSDGTIKQFHYSISLIKGTPGYKPRKADERVGYFTTSFRDLGQFDRYDVDNRLVNRWHLEKADPSLKLSPPKQPIVYYIEHTVPVRYRRWVREGIEYWNEAYRKIGIDGAIEVRYQDKKSGAHMEKDPEDVRYNFIRWLSNDISTAIGPSRVNPMTGEILDADVVLTDGWLRVFTYRWEELLPNLAMEGFDPETVSWLARNPQWDPRVRMAPAGEREQIMAERSRGLTRFGAHPALSADPTLLGDDEYDGLAGRISQVNGMCRAADGMAMGMAMMRMHLGSIESAQRAEAEMDDGKIDPAILKMMRKQLEENPELIETLPADVRAALEADDEDAEEGDGVGSEGPDKKAPADDEEQSLDGVPEWFVGPALAELTAHEVGHTIGLRHNFKGSSYYTLAELNSDEVKGKEAWSMSVMDYNGINIRMPGVGEVQGDYSVINIGPYDYWAIEYGYGFGDPAEVASRAADPKLQFGTDEDTWGPDPTARRYDLSADPLEYAENTMRLNEQLRKDLLDHFVEDGESWARARRGYLITLGQQTRSLSMMANWVGSAYTYRDKKGDPNGRVPVEPVSAAKQRAALQFVCDNAFKDEAYGLNPDMLRHLTVDKWWDLQGLSSVTQDASFDLHDRVLGIQASSLTMLMNPRTLQRVYDLEAFVPADEDALTLPEVFDTVSSSVWSELDGSPTRKHTSRQPMVSSLRRNLQREHLGRLIDLSLLDGGVSASENPVKQLAAQSLRDLDGKLEASLSNGAAGKADPYTRAHLTECRERIAKALEAGYIYNMPESIFSFGGSIFGAEPAGK
ncbi:MAG: hypothetical protein DHS20C14_07820 [Phycisphaeraceae bacterium]|nr:MAG: hypothetical protein DHS20C14_07820 [Phycisphaeraceae bacterium]